MLISSEHFPNGNKSVFFQGANIDLSDAEIEILMKNLDEDNSGTIEMRYIE